MNTLVYYLKSMSGVSWSKRIWKYLPIWKQNRKTFIFIQNDAHWYENV